ncbi:MAG: hypothetical protein ACQEUT_11540 [Bacillota bacterium]
MLWLPIFIIGILLFAFLIDIRRKSRGNDHNLKGINPGEDKNYNAGPGP